MSVILGCDWFLQELERCSWLTLSHKWLQRLLGRKQQLWKRLHQHSDRFVPQGFSALLHCFSFSQLFFLDHSFLCLFFPFILPLFSFPFLLSLSPSLSPPSEMIYREFSHFFLLLGIVSRSPYI